MGLADLLSGLSFAWERICGNVKPINPFFYPTSLPFLEGLLNLNMFVVIGTAAYQNRHAVSQLYGAQPVKLDLNKKSVPKQKTIQNLTIDAQGFRKTKNENPPTWEIGVTS